MKRIRSVLAQIEARDVCLFGGLFSVAFGAGMVYLPAAFIVFGLVLLYLGLFGVPSWR